MLLGEEGFERVQQPPHRQAVGEADASLGGSSRQREQLGHRLAELLHTVHDLTVFLGGRGGGNHTGYVTIDDITQVTSHNNIITVSVGMHVCVCVLPVGPR